MARLLRPMPRMDKASQSVGPIALRTKARSRIAHSTAWPAGAAKRAGPASILRRFTTTIFFDEVTSLELCKDASIPFNLLQEHPHNINAAEFDIYEDQPAQFPLSYALIARKPD